MNQNLLKTGWERNRPHVSLDLKSINNLVSRFCDDRLDTFFIINNGCANTNIKLNFSSREPLLLRVYTRDPAVLEKEIALHNLVNKTILVPRVYYSDSSCELLSHPFALMEWIEGELMRDVILRKNIKAIGECVFEAGYLLSKLSQFKMPYSGFILRDLKIKPFKKCENIAPYILRKVSSNKLSNFFKEESINHIKQILSDHEGLLNINKSNLVHGDFDPSNIIVKKINGKYRIRALLDFEFAFSSSSYFDMGTFLRYSHRLPSVYEEKFIEAVRFHQFFLDKQWKRILKLHDLLCLIQLLDQT